jgi:hypothetical protein
MLNSTLEKILNYLKIIGLAAPAFGIYFIVTFFVEYKIPLPVDVKSALFLVPVIAIAGLMISVYSLVGLFMPSVFLDWTELNLKPLFYGDKDKENLPILIRRYVWFYGGVYAFLFGIGFFPTLFKSSDGSFGWGLGMLIPYAGLVVAHLLRDRNFSLKDTGKYFFIIFITNFIFIIWLGLIAVFMTRYLEELFPGLPNMGAFWLVFPPILAFHFLQTVLFSKTLHEKPKQRNKLTTMLSAIAIIAALMPQFAPFIGKASLRFFELGGGKPIRVHTTGFHAETMPAWMEAKERGSGTTYLMFKSPTSLYLLENEDSKITDKMSLKNIRRIEYLSSKGEIEFIDHEPFIPRS